ncbi:MAG: DUF58 domain-containing protein [Bryobacteraceae bacterium]
MIDQALLEKLERLALHWNRSLPGSIGGRKTSRFPGPGQEFLDHRNFHHGDDLRSVNWRAYLRLDKLFLKMFQIEPRLPVRFLLDVSGSMSTGSPAKIEYAKRLTAALCYIGLVRLDAICIQPFRESLIESLLCGGGRHRFQPAANFLSSFQAEGRTSYLQVARQFASLYPQRGLLVVISDFLDDEDASRPLQYLAEFGHELLLLHIIAPEDRQPQWDGDMELVDSESGRHLELSLDQNARHAYTQAWDAHARRLQDLANRNGGKYVAVPTDTQIEEAIFGPLVQSGGLQ